MELHVKNMVCGRCMKTVKQVIASELGDTNAAVSLGLIKLQAEPTAEQLNNLKAALGKEGFELIDDQKTRLVQQVKNLIVELVHYKDLSDMSFKLSTFLGAELHRDYNYISNLFSAVENYTIEQFFILQKIEKVKEWLVYDEMSLSNMAFRLGYSSTAHLSAQFKKITGFTPSQFKQVKDHKRTELDKI